MNFKAFVSYAAFINIIFLFSCTVTTTKTKNPEFTISLDSIARDINSIIFTPKSNIQGEQITSNGQTRTELIINLINSRNLPSDASSQDSIGQYVAILLKHALKDPNAFTDFTVKFTRAVTEGSITRSKYSSYSYKSSILKNYIQIVTLGDRFDTIFAKAIGKTEFSINDPQIVSVFTYYNNIPGSPITIKLYKQIDSSMVLVTARNMGYIEPGNRYLVTNLGTSSLYKSDKLKEGTYLIKYLVSDTAVGEKLFKLL